MPVMRFRMAAAVLSSIVLALSACESGSPTEPGTQVAFTTVLKATVAGFAPAGGQREIRDRATWQAAWAELHAENVPPLPAVDFSREMVVLVTGPGCCGTVEVRSIERRGGELTVHALSRASNNTVCVVPDFSVHAVRLARQQDPARFAVAKESGPCQR